MSSAGNSFETERVGETLVMVPQDNLNELHIEQFQQVIGQVLEQIESHEVRHIVLDFNRTEYYGSSALGVFVKLWKHVRDADGNMAFCHVSPYEREILAVTRLDKLWTICTTREDALAAVRDTSTRPPE